MYIKHPVSLIKEDKVQDCLRNLLFGIKIVCVPITSSCHKDIKAGYGSNLRGNLTVAKVFVDI